METIMSASPSFTAPVPLSAALAAIVAAAAPSLVAVQGRRSRSSGFAWRDNLVVTADEALPDDDEITIRLGGGESRAVTVVGRDPSTDIAVLRVDGAGLVPMRLDAPPPAIGSLALACASHDGMPSAAFGIVSLVAPAWRSLRGGDIAARIELDLRLPHGAEGGLAVDAEGKAFGMVVRGPRHRVLALPGATINEIAERLLRDGRVGRGYLGLALHSVRIAADQPGLMVMNVDPKGPGATAGVRQGDVIAAWDGQPVRGVGRLLRELGPTSIGRTIHLSLRRGGEPMELDLSVGERLQE